MKTQRRRAAAARRSRTASSSTQRASPASGHPYGQTQGSRTDSHLSLHSGSRTASRTDGHKGSHSGRMATEHPRGAYAPHDEAERCGNCPEASADRCTACAHLTSQRPHPEVQWTHGSTADLADGSSVSPPSACAHCRGTLTGLPASVRLWHIRTCPGLPGGDDMLAAALLVTLACRADGQPNDSQLDAELVGIGSSLPHPFSPTGACCDSWNSSYPKPSPLSLPAARAFAGLGISCQPSPGCGPLSFLRSLPERARRLAWRAATGKLIKIFCPCGVEDRCCALIHRERIQVAAALLAAALARYRWPLTQASDLVRLLQDPLLSPTHLMGGEFTASMRGAFEARGVRALSVDTRECELPKMHFTGDLREVMQQAVDLGHRWQVAFFWPPCTHQVLSDRLCLIHKVMDGRAYFGIAFFLLCYTCPNADCIVVEQPDTIIPDFICPPTFRVLPSDFGDAHSKPINLYCRGTRLRPASLSGDCAALVGPRRAFSSFANSDERDRWRSSWAHYPAMTRALALWLESTEPAPPLCFAEELRAFAAAWSAAGLPIPSGGLDAWARPLDAEYQGVRGRGDGRRPHSDAVVPVRLKLSQYLLPHVPIAAAVGAAARCLHIIFVVQLSVPLVLASTSDTRLVGIALPSSGGTEITFGSSLMSAATRVVELAGWLTPPLCYLAGRAADGSGVIVAPVHTPPPSFLTAHYPSCRTRLAAAGVGLAWATMRALGASPAFEASALAIHSLASLTGGLSSSALARFRSLHVFSTGHGHPHPMPTDDAIPPTLALRREAAVRKSSLDIRALTAHLLGYRGPFASDMRLWADQVQPPPLSEVPDALLEQVETAEVPMLLNVPFEPIPAPLNTTWLPRRPQQPHMEACPKHAFELLQPAARMRLRLWLVLELRHARCVEAQSRGEECAAARPRPLALGRGALHPYARGIVWDFTFERHPTCGVPLDFHTPIQSDLNLEYLARRLADFPDQRLLSYLVEGVRFEADVEEQAIFCSSLVSLPHGFASVRKEIQRLHGRGWYRFFPHIPLWPFRANSQGAIARKLEPDRWRRTTDGGSPRRETFDEDGVRAISVNDASKHAHLPRHFSHLLTGSAPSLAPVSLSSPESIRRNLEAGWRLIRGPTWDPDLNPGAKRHRPAAHPSKWPPQRMPTIDAVMRDLTILRHAAQMLGEPLYVFCDDAADYFSQLALAPEDWNLMGVIFLQGEGDDLPPAPPGSAEPGGLIFISERRLGFGTHPASNIAQRFSESLLHLFREDMDRAEHDAEDHEEERPALRRWREGRAQVEKRHGGKQDRLYFSAIYCDDPLHACVGMWRCTRMLRIWRQLTLDARILMAIPEKRMLGVWLKWLGILIFAALGFVLIPADKIMRAIGSIRRALRGIEDFSSYRALVGLLEHIRAIERIPRSRMYHLYAPHQGDPDPNEPVFLCPDGRRQLAWWERTLQSVGGVPLTRALGWKHLPTRGHALTVVIYSDAASEGAGAGLGGFCQGFYWYIPLSREHLRWLHITALELLAAGIGAVTLAPLVPSEARITLMVDASTSVDVLTRQSARSPMLMHIHQMLLDMPDFCKLSQRAECAHIAGLANVAADLASRGRIAELKQLCSQARLRAERIEPPPHAADLVERAASWGMRRGVEVAPPPQFVGNTRPRVVEGLDLAVDRAMSQGRGKQFRHNSDGDGPPTHRRSGNAEAADLLRAALIPSARPARESPSATNSVERSTAIGGGREDGSQPSRRSAPPTTTTAQPGNAEAAYLLRATLLPSAGPAREPSPSGSSAMHATESGAGRAINLPPRCRAALSTTLTFAERPTDMPLATIQGVGVATSVGARVAPRLAAATTEVTQRSLDRWKESPFGRHVDLDVLSQMLCNSNQLSLYGASHGTLKKDELAWKRWEDFARWLGFEPLVRAEDASAYQDHLGTMLAQFMLWIYPTLTGRGCRWARPRSAFAYVLAVIRVFKRWRIPCPPAKVVKGELQGLLRTFTSTFGRLALTPRRKEPFTFKMIRLLFDHAQSGLALARGRRWSNSLFHTRQTKRIMLFLWRTGNRLASVVAHPSGELMFTTRADATYVIDKTEIADPAPHTLSSMRAGRGDGIWVAPCRSKTDQFGETWCGYGSFLPYEPHDLNAAFHIQQLELERPCRGAARATTALFTDEHGTLYTHSALDDWLDSLLTAAFGEARCQRYSWHSFRIGLACSLHAAGCSDGHIQLICRWASPESLKIYRRVGATENAYWCDAAEKVSVDTVQMTNVPIVDNMEGMAAIDVAYGRAACHRRIPDRQPGEVAPPPKRRKTTPAAAAAHADSSSSDDDDDDHPLPAHAGPLTSANARGARLLCPASVWPDFPCRELDGEGWRCRVVSIPAPDTLRIHFTKAVDERGIAYEDAYVSLQEASTWRRL